MMFKNAALLMALLASTTTDAFVVQNAPATSTTSLQSSLGMNNDSIPDIRRQLNYKPGGADTELARKYGHLVNAKIKTVGEAFSEFTSELGFTVNPLYKNMVTDLVGTTHLNVVNARFERDAVWSMGLFTVMELLLKNYPESEVGDKIVSSLIKSVGLDEATLRAESESMKAWAQGKTKEEIEAALMGEGDSPLAAIAANIKGNKYWMYSRYFGIGLIKLMELSGMDMEKDECYALIENWMSEKLGRSPLTACNDSDLFFKSKEKLDMMETMMKEIEIREKKRLAERLENKAEAALRAADREEKLQLEIEKEAASNREKVDA